jgi:hypothetical protein
LADETGLSVDTARSLLEDPGAAKASLDAELEKAGRQALLGMVGDEETLRVVLEEPGVGVEEIVRKQVEAELDRRFENRPEVRGLAESVLDGDADAARQQLQQALARQVSSVSEVVTPLLDLAADPGPERLAALAAQLEDRGLLPPEAASAIADARTLRDRLADEAWKWAIDAAEIRLFAYRDCIAAITAGESSAVANACRPWLEDLELVDVERFKVCSPPDAELARLAEAVKGGDVAAIGAVLLRCRLTSQVPEIRDLDLQALASDPAALRGQLTEQARRRLTEELDEVAPGLGGALESLDTDGGSAALGIVAEGVGGSLRHFAAAMQSGDYSTAADALLRARDLPQSLQRLLSEEERAILEDLPQLGVAETVRQLADAFAARAMEAGSKLARETSPGLVGVLEIAECLKTSPPETCESLKQVWIGDRVDTALAEVPDSMRKSIAAGDAVGLGEAVVDYGLRKPLEELGLGAIAEECRSANEAAFEGCLVLRGALVPALERRGINLQPETLDEILEDGVLDLGDLKALVAAAGNDGLQVVEQFTGMPRKELLELVQTPDPLRSPERVAELKEKFVASAAEQLGIETQRLSDLLGRERPTAP